MNKLKLKPGVSINRKGVSMSTIPSMKTGEVKPQAQVVQNIPQKTKLDVLKKSIPLTPLKKVTTNQIIKERFQSFKPLKNKNSYFPGGDKTMGVIPPGK